MASQIHHLNCGTMCPYCAPLLEGQGRLTDPAELVCHCLLVETNQGLVLVDTGFGTQDIDQPAKRLGRSFMALSRPRLAPLETAYAQVQALGYDPTDVRHIVLTHMDLDHAGGIGDFPSAQVHVHRPEWQAATQPTRRERRRYRPMQWDRHAGWSLHDTDGESWMGFDSIRAIPELGDEILLIPLVGHTRGHSGVGVKTPEGWILHAGDAYFYHGQMADDPVCPAGLSAFQRLLAVDNSQRLHNTERLRQLALTEPAVQVICSHDRHYLPT